MMEGCAPTRIEEANGYSFGDEFSADQRRRLGSIFTRIDSLYGGDEGQASLSDFSSDIDEDSSDYRRLHQLVDSSLGSGAWRVVEGLLADERPDRARSYIISVSRATIGGNK